MHVHQEGARSHDRDLTGPLGAPAGTSEPPRGASIRQSSLVSVTAAHEAEEGRARQKTPGGNGDALHGTALGDRQGTGLRGSEHALGIGLLREHGHPVKDLLV